VLKIRITDRVSPGTVFIPMHYAEAAVNVLTSDTRIDSFSKTPGYKITAVRVEPAREGE
jgi:formate dehydrogenase major subunit